MNNPFDFVSEGCLFKSTLSSDFIVDSAILPLFNKYKEILVDDYWGNTDSDNCFKRLIDYVSPYFFSMFDEKGQFFGYMFLSDWKGGYKSCSFHIVVDDKFQGSYVIKRARKVAQALFDKFGLQRIDCNIPIYNKKVIAFAEKILKAKFEGIHKNVSMKNGQPLDYAIYAKTIFDNKGD